MELRTPRLLLRQWREEDRAAFAAMNADPEVREYLVVRSTGRQAKANLRVGARRLMSSAGVFGRWSDRPIALIKPVNFESWFTPAVEIGWRLARAHWGQGYASEAARGRSSATAPGVPSCSR